MTVNDTKTTDSLTRKYARINRFSKNNSIVFFGSTYFSEFPVCELSKTLGLDEFVYNRSIKNMSIDDAQDYLKECVFELNPKKVFIEIGEEDLARANFNFDEFFEKYEWLLYSIHSETQAMIYIISTFGPDSEKVNEGLKLLSNEDGCTYIDISDIYASDNYEMEIMNRLKHYMRSATINFFDAMNINVI